MVSYDDDEEEEIVNIPKCEEKQTVNVPKSVEVPVPSVEQGSEQPAAMFVTETTGDAEDDSRPRKGIRITVQNMTSQDQTLVTVTSTPWKNFILPPNEIVNLDIMKYDYWWRLPPGKYLCT